MYIPKFAIQKNKKSKYKYQTKKKIYKSPKGRPWLHQSNTPTKDKTKNITSPIRKLT